MLKIGRIAAHLQGTAERGLKTSYNELAANRAGRFRDRKGLRFAAIYGDCSQPRW
jgi:hypothetical protein